jgi:hypothetical protein
LVDVIVAAGTTMVDLIDEEFEQVKSIGRVYKWSDTFDKYCYVKRCHRVNEEGESYRVEAVLKAYSDMTRNWHQKPSS